MTQTGTVTRLAVRELWMTFRLVLLLLAYVGAGAVVGLLPSASQLALERLAMGLGAAGALAAATAAWSLAQERRAGRTGWLVMRSVPRGSYLVGWFTALVLVCLAGLAVAVAVGWLAAAGGLSGVGANGFVAASIAVAATVAAAVALGLLAGAGMPPLPAAASAVAACAAAGALAVALFDRLPFLPGGAHVLLARSAETPSVAPDAIQAAGIGLALSGALLVAARMVLERAEL